MGLLYSFSGASKAGGAQGALVENYDGRVPTANLTLTIQTVYLQKVRVGRPVTITKVSCWTSAALGNVDAAVFDSDGVTRIAASAGAVAAAAAAMTDVTLAAAFTFVPGKDYALAILVTDAGAAVKGISSTAAQTGVGSRSLSRLVSQGTIPASITAGAATGLSPWIVGS